MRWTASIAPAEAAAAQASSNLAHAFEESTRRTIGQIDQILRSARAFYAAEGPRFSFDDWARAQALPDTDDRRHWHTGCGWAVTSSSSCCPGYAQPAAAIPLVQLLLQRLAEPMQVGDHRLRIGASIGAAFHPRDAQDGDSLFKFADIALYAAKAAGRGTFRCFDAAMTQAVNERRLLEGGLRRALDNAEFELHFQPIFDGDLLAVTGFEALTRWRPPGGGTVPPEIFIRIAEDCGLINRLGQWVLEPARAAAAAWPLPCRVAVNVSPVQLRDGRLAGRCRVRAAAQRTGRGISGN